MYALLLLSLIGSLKLATSKFVILGHHYPSFEFEFMRIEVLGIKLWSLFYGWMQFCLIGLHKKSALVQGWQLVLLFSSSFFV
jgi:hypothetical protein